MIRIEKPIVPVKSGIGRKPKSEEHALAEEMYAKMLKGDSCVVVVDRPKYLLTCLNRLLNYYEPIGKKFSYRTEDSGYRFICTQLFVPEGYEIPQHCSHIKYE